MNCLEGFAIDAGHPPMGRHIFVNVSRHVRLVTMVCMRGRQFPGGGDGCFEGCWKSLHPLGLLEANVSLLNPARLVAEHA